jgi:16S rRNA (guanine966-N2)-methyltransferase
MTRIIGGKGRGRRLRTPAGGLTRPTSDRVREALFSRLISRLGALHNLSFLDLYAGSGAVGLEAWSRGATRVTLVENNRKVADLIRQNIAELGVADLATVASTPVRSHLLSGAPIPFDMIFLDPPYEVSSAEVHEVLTLLVAHHWVASGSTVVVERSRRSGELTWPPGFVCEPGKAYGETMLWFAECNPAQ